MNKCLWKGSRNECESQPYCRRCTWGQNCKLPNAWGMISHVRASFSKDWMGNAAKSVTLLASRQNGLLMPWLIVAYALFTMLAHHPNTQSIVQTACLCLRCQPPWSLLLLPGVFKPSCSTPFTLFLCLVSVYWPFQLYFIPKTLHNTSVFSSLLTAYFYLTGHSPAFIYNTTLLYRVLLALCGHLQTQRVCHALHPVSGGMGSWWLRSPVGSNTLLRPGLPLDGRLGWPDPINWLVVLCPNFD